MPKPAFAKIVISLSLIFPAEFLKIYLKFISMYNIVKNDEFKGYDR